MTHRQYISVAVVTTMYDHLWGIQRHMVIVMKKKCLMFHYKDDGLTQPKVTKG